MAATVRQRMQDDLVPAMRARDRVKVSVLRSTLAAFANAEAVDAVGAPLVTTGLYATEMPRAELSDDDVRAIVARERDALRSTATTVQAHGEADAADELQRKADILDAYLRA